MLDLESSVPSKKDANSLRPLRGGSNPCTATRGFAKRTSHSAPTTIAVGERPLEMNTYVKNAETEDKQAN